MVEVGKLNKLKVERLTDFGLIFDGLQLGDILIGT